MSLLFPFRFLRPPPVHCLFLRKYLLLYLLSLQLTCHQTSGWFILDKPVNLNEYYYDSSQQPYHLPRPLAYAQNEETNEVVAGDATAEEEAVNRGELEDDSENRADTSSSNGTYAINDERLCPRNREEAVARGRTCLRKCNSDSDCISTRKKCLCDGLCGWSCVRPDLSCDELGEVNNGRYLLNNGNFFNSKVTYECEPGYFMSGQRTRICQGDSSWSGQSPDCKVRPLCGPAPSIPHSKHSLSESTTTEFELNTTLIYECFNGYKIQGTTEAICQQHNNTTNWIGPNLKCMPISCGDPGEIANGYRESTGHVFTSKVSYFCNEGYVLFGRAIRYCQSSGLWSSDMPSCQPIKCAQPEDPRNGRAFYTSYTFGSVVTYQCKAGYRLFGPSNRTCQADRQWSDIFPQCNIIDCGPLVPYPNGYIEADSTTIGSRIRFFCYDNMIFEGTFNTSLCTANSTWDPYPFPACMAPCTVPKIANGRVLNHAPMTKLPHRYAINVSCINDYELLEQGGDKVIECRNGTWSQLPKCVPARCKTLPERPRNGLVIAPKTDHGMRALFHCRDGYLLEGSNITFCHFGRWNISTPLCTQIYCPFPGYIEHGKVMLVGHMGMYDYRPYVRRVSNSKQILYECDKHYHIAEGGPLGSTCVDGAWSPAELPTCVRFFHPKLSRWNRDLVKKNAAVVLEQSPVLPEWTAMRHKRHQLNKIKSSCFTLPQKPATKVTILKLGKDQGLIVANGTVLSGNETAAAYYPHGTRVKIACEEGYGSTNPNRTVIKCAKGRWKPELPDCNPTPCITPTIPNGQFRLSSLKRRSRKPPILLAPGQSVPHNGTIDLLCNDGFYYGSTSPILNVTLRCSFGSWDSFASTASSCVPLPCKLPVIRHGGYLNGFEAGQLVEHEVGVKYSCDQGYRRQGASVEDLEASDLKCNLGKLEPEPPLCVTHQNGSSSGPISERLFQGEGLNIQSPASCQTPKKIENAMHFFGQKLFGSKPNNGGGLGAGIMQPISIAQFDNAGGDFRSSSSRPLKNDTTSFYQYEHGTEIVYRCVNYEVPIEHPVGAVSGTGEGLEDGRSIPSTMTTPLGTTPPRSTWIIKCENGNWIGSAFTCEDDISTTPPPTEATPQPTPPAPCSLTQSDPNVLIFNGTDQTPIDNCTSPTTFSHDSLILIRCKDIGKYQLSGPKERLCRNGQWSPPEGEETRCAGLNQEYSYDVQKPPTIQFRNSNGPIAQTADGKLLVYPGTILHLECLFQRKLGSPSWSWSHPGRPQGYQQQWATEERLNSLAYRLTIFHAKDVDSGVYTCGTPASHSHSVEILVKAVHCPSLENYPNLRFSTDANSADRFGAEVQFSCPPGRILWGANSAVCLPSGSWSNPIPECQITQCPDLTKYFLLGSPPSVEGAISGSGDPASKIIPAEMVPPIPEERRIGDKILYSCPKGFGLQGSHQLFCQSDGNWSSPVPYCVEVRCPPPTAPAFGYLEGGGLVDPGTGSTSGGPSYTAGDIVQYGCEPGYMLDGNPISICQETGRWSGPQPTCQAACTYPGINQGARLLSEVRFFYPLNQTLEFECAEGYEMRGNAAIKCIESAKWSGSIPECVPE